MTGKRRKRAEDTLKVGDQVKVAFGSNELLGTIIEDRGNIGINARRILRVRIDLGPGEEFELEAPAEELIPAA